MLLDEAVDAFSEVLSELGMGLLRPPADLGPLEAVQRAVAPLVVPEEVCRWWSLVDAEAVPLMMLPNFTGPAWALETWQEARDEFADMQPLTLLTVGYEAQHVMSVELGSSAGPGGVLYEWDLVDGEFMPAYTGIASWVQAVTAALRDGPGEIRPWGEGATVFLDNDAVQRVPDPAAVMVEADILAWPSHWQRAAGLQPADIAPRGATHRISELLSERPSAVVTVRGRVVSLAGWSAATFVRIHDGTGELAVTCSNEVTLLGPVIDAWFELDVQLLPQKPEETLTITADDPEMAEFVHRYAGPADAAALAIRRVDPPLA